MLSPSQIVARDTCHTRLLSAIRNHTELDIALARGDTSAAIELSSRLHRDLDAMRDRFEDMRDRKPTMESTP